MKRIFLIILIATSCNHTRDKNSFNTLADSLFFIELQIDKIKNDSLSIEKELQRKKIIDIRLKLEDSRGSEVKLRMVEKEFKELKKIVDSLVKENKYLRKKDSINNSIHYFEPKAKYHF